MYKKMSDEDFKGLIEVIELKMFELSCLQALFVKETGRKYCAE